MTLSRIGRFGLALVVSVAVGLGMTACGGGTIGYMWVLGTTPSGTAGQLTGQIAGFKIDDYTGNLTSAVHSPFSSGGTNPVSIVIKPGGRYVYVVNEGFAGTGFTSCANPPADYIAGTISVFSVGGDGTLTYQTNYPSQGCNPVWAAVDSSGGFLYVLDQKSPAYTTTGGVTDLNGDITVFSIASDTGRLSLVTNAQVKNANGTQLPYFEVGPSPNMMRVSAGCVYTVDQGDDTVFPYSVGSAGQLSLTTNSRIPVIPTNTVGTPLTPVLTSISAAGSYVYLTDAANNLVLPYTAGSNCSLNSLTGGSVPNLPLTSNPVYTVTDAKSAYLYVLNQSGTNPNQPSSSISAFNVEPSGGKLQQVGGVSNTSNPYPVGSGPVCMAEDPTGQYFYISNSTDGTVTGKRIVSSTGELVDLSRGSTFPAVGKATCLAISPNVQ